MYLIVVLLSSSFSEEGFIARHKQARAVQSNPPPASMSMNRWLSGTLSIPWSIVRNTQPLTKALKALVSEIALQMEGHLKGDC